MQIRSSTHHPCRPTSPTNAEVINVDSPLSTAITPYAASKRAVEEWVRAQQEQGVPIVTLVLGAVYGPPSPHPESSFTAILNALGREMMIAPPSGVGVVDVRDVANLITRCIAPGSGPRRYVAGGTFLTWRSWTETLSEAAGVKLAVEEFSPEDLITLGRDLDALRAAGTPVPGSLSEEAATIMSSGRPTDDSVTLQALGCTFRPALETFRDTVHYLRSIGLLPTGGT